MKSFFLYVSSLKGCLSILIGIVFVLLIAYMAVFGSRGVRNSKLKILVIVSMSLLIILLQTFLSSTVSQMKINKIEIIHNTTSVILNQSQNPEIVQFIQWDIFRWELLANDESVKKEINQNTNGTIILYLDKGTITYDNYPLSSILSKMSVD